jgi:CDP-diglyceride synthetase
MILGLNPIVGTLSAGFLAVVFYRQRHPGAVIEAATGTRLGALGGIFCFVITVLFVALAATVSDVGTKIREQVIENCQKWAAARPPDPQIQSTLDQIKTPEGLVMLLVILAILFFLLAVVCGSLGGALGGAIFSRRGKP